MISKSAVLEFLDRPRDSFTWMKRLTEKELRAELNQLRVKPRFKTDPWLHQLVCFYIGLCCPNFLFLLDMGTGKTKIILDLITHALRERRLKQALVVVPRLINLDSWETATLQHSHLEPNLVMGCVEEKWERLLKPQGELSVVDYHGLALALSVKKKTKKGNKLTRDDKKVAQLKKLYNFVVPDEIHKLQNPDSLWFGILWQLMKDAEYRFGLTGTPFGRDPTSAWSQFYLIDKGDTLGTTLGMYRQAFFTEKTDFWGGKVFEFDRRMDRDFHRIVQHRSIRYEESEVQDLPPRMVIPVDLHFADDQREAYLHAIDGVIAAGGNLEETNNCFVRMRQITSGYVEWEDESGRHHVSFAENPKLAALEGILETSNGEKVVVFHDYTATGRMICEHLASLDIKHEWLHGGCKDPVGMVKKFKTDPRCRVFVANSECGGTGVDGLQDVCRYVVFFESPVDPRTRQQAEKRVHRSGQKRRVYIYDLTLRRSVDHRILEFHAQGRSLAEALIDGRESPKKWALI